MSFGPSPVTVSEIVNAVVSNFLFGAPRDAQIVSIKHALEKLGIPRGYRVYFTPLRRPRIEREWLLGLAWWEPGRGTVLAAECQWGDAADILHDFERLMAVKSPLKLLIFASRRAGAEREDVLMRTDIDAVLQVLGTALADFSQHVEGETYVLLEHVESNSTFHAYEFRVPKDGKLNVSFEQARTLFRRLEIAAAMSA